MQFTGTAVFCDTHVHGAGATNSFASARDAGVDRERASPLTGVQLLDAAMQKDAQTGAHGESKYICVLHL
jgi:hypothetical protein